MPQQAIDHHVSTYAETVSEDLYADCPYLSATKPDFVVDIELGKDELAPVSGEARGNCLTRPNCFLIENHSMNSVEPYAGSPYLSGTEPDFVM